MKRNRFTNKEWLTYYIDNLKINMSILERYGRSDFIKSEEAKEFLNKSVSMLGQAVPLLEEEYKEMENNDTMSNED